MKKLVLVLFLALSMLSYSLAVFDPTNFGVNLETKIATLRQITNQVKSLENEARSLSNQAKQLKQMDPSLSVGSIQQLRNNLQQILALQNDTRSTIDNYLNLQGEFEKLYPNYVDSKYRTSEDYSNQARRLQNELNSVTYDTMKALKIANPEKYKSDTDKINAIMNGTKNAEGQLQAIQAVGQMSALTGQQLMELKYLTSQSLKLQSTYIAKQNQEKIMEERQEEDALKIDVDTTGANSGLLTNDGRLKKTFK